MENRILIDRFAVKNYRSIKECDVQLGPLTFLVGANGSGKTSFVDAILFVSSALSDSLQKAISNRGGIRSILHQPEGSPRSLSFDFDISLPQKFRCKFHLLLTVSEDDSVAVTREECWIEHMDGHRHSYIVDGGIVTGTAPVFPAVSIDRVFLANASGLPEFRLIFEYLSGIRGSSFFMRDSPSMFQHRSSLKNGLAYRYKSLYQNRPDRLEVIQEYLRAIAPPFDSIMVRETDGELSLRFVAKSPSGEKTSFDASQSSSGLLHSADALLELFEPPAKNRPASLVIIEEPEAFLHPAAIQVMLDGFKEASNIRQILLTTHSPDLLDDKAIPAEWIRAVQKDEMGSRIMSLDSSTKSIIQDHLYTPGQLLRQDGLY